MARSFARPRPENTATFYQRRYQIGYGSKQTNVPGMKGGNALVKSVTTAVTSAAAGAPGGPRVLQLLARFTF